MRRAFCYVCFFCGWALTAPAQTIQDVYSRPPSADAMAVIDTVETLATLAQDHIATVGLDRALDDFQSAPWYRESDSLHFWGVTRSGIGWFETRNPALIGLDLSLLTDLEGAIMSTLATQGARSGITFDLLLPHATYVRAVRSFNNCFLLEDDTRILCASQALAYE